MLMVELTFVTVFGLYELIQLLRSRRGVANARKPRSIAVFRHCWSTTT